MTIFGMQTLPLSSQNQKPLPSSLHGGAELSKGRFGTDFMKKIIPQNSHFVERERPVVNPVDANIVAHVPDLYSVLDGEVRFADGHQEPVESFVDSVMNEDDAVMPVHSSVSD